MNDERDLAQTLAELEARVAALEANQLVREDAVTHARRTMELLRKRRLRGGARTWEGAQRAALRFVVLAAGCVALVTGGAALDGTLAGVTIVASFGVLVFEGLR